MKHIVDYSGTPNRHEVLYVVVRGGNSIDVVMKRRRKHGIDLFKSSFDITIGSFIVGLKLSSVAAAFMVEHNKSEAFVLPFRSFTECCQY